MEGKSCDLVICGFVDLASLRSPSARVGIWLFVDLCIWLFGIWNLEFGIWGFGDLGIWIFSLVTYYSKSFICKIKSY